MNDPKTKIIFILPSLRAGGAERVVSFLAQNLNKQLFVCELLILESANDQAYSVDDIKTTFLRKSRTLYAVPGIFRYIRANSPQLVFSSIGQVNILLGALKPFLGGSRIIVREASVGSELAKYSSTKPSYWLRSIMPILSSFGYRNINHIVCQSRDMANDFINNRNITEDKITIINNPITGNFKYHKKKQPSNAYKKFITVGRLSKEKGHVRLLKLLAKCDFPFTYTLIGDGPEKDEIFALIATLNLENKITHIPFTSEIADYLKEHDLFLQGSFVEGFPNSLLESCAVGTPVLAFNAPGGTKEIVEHGVNGYMAETEEEFLEYLNKPMIWNPLEIMESVNQKFSQKNIILQYQALFLKVLQQKP